MTNRTSFVLLASAAVLVAFVAFNALLGAAVRGARVDLTSDRLYTLSPGVRPLLARLSEPVRLDLFYSAEAARGIPAVATYAQRVREFLEELVSASGGKLSLRVVDPLPYSEAEDEAVAAGLASLSVDGAGRTLTLGLVATNSVDQRKALPFLDPANEPFLEYDILRLIESVGRTGKARIGLLSTLPIGGGFDPRTPGRPAPAWQIDQQLRELFQVLDIQPGDATLPPDLDALVLIQPRGLEEGLLREIDAYALGGGRILAFLDPLCEHAPQNPQAMGLGPERTYDLGSLPAAWGIDIPTSQVVGDRTFALRVQTRGRNGPEVVDYIAWLGVDRRGLNLDDPVTGALDRLNLTTVGAIGAAAAGASSTIIPLVHSSAESMMLETATLSFMPDPARLLTQFRSDDTVRNLAVRVGGTIRSGFAARGPDEAPGGQAGAGAAPIEAVPMTAPTAPKTPTAPETPSAPAPDPTPAEDQPPQGRGPFAREAPEADDAAPESASAAVASPPAESAAPAQTPPARPVPSQTAPAAIIVVADADLLADENWIVEEQVGPISLGARTIADNGAFVLNAIEMLTGDQAMLSLRGRGEAARPFERVEQIRRAAETRYLARERELEDQIAEAQRKIGELQRARPAQGEGQLILTPEQEKELDQLERDVLDARKELRQVQFNLRSDYETLGNRLMVVNVVAWPLMVALTALAWSVHRSHRAGTRRRGRAA